MTNSKPDATAVPDWWHREAQRRQMRILMFLVVVLALIGFYHYLSALGNTGLVNGIAFDTSNYLSFVRADATGNSTLYAVKPDGTGLTALTPPEDHSVKSSPAWEVDGKSIVYASNLNDAKTQQIYILGTGAPKQITYGTGSKFNPFVCSDGRRIGFLVQGAVKTVNVNGTDVIQIMPLPRSTNEDSEGQSAKQDAIDINAPFLSALFASDGVAIAGAQDLTGDTVAASVRDDIGADQVVVVNLSPDARTLPLDRGREVSFSWEPNGKRLACAFAEMEAPDESGKKTLVSGIRIWSFEKPTQPTVHPFFAGLGHSIEPRNIVWSPDGDRIAFEAWKLQADGSRELGGIIVMKTPSADSSEPGVVVTEALMPSVRYLVPADAAGRPENPRWSPDGSRFSYELVRPDGKRDLCVINSDGTNRLNLTNGIGDNFDAAWAPIKSK